MNLCTLRLGAYLLLGLSQVLASEIDDSLVCKICNGYQICGWKQSQMQECPNGIHCTEQQYLMCAEITDTIQNQKCDHLGKFADRKHSNKFFTCEVNNSTMSFDKRTGTCPDHKTFDPVTKHCLSAEEKRVLKVAEKYNSSHDEKRFVCKEVGIFPDPQDCKIYHSCNAKLESQDFYCPDGRYFDGVKCTPTKRCLQQLEKNWQNQLRRGEEIYRRVKELLATPTTSPNSSSSPRLIENSFQDSVGTKYTLYAIGEIPTPKVLTFLERSVTNLQKIIKDEIREQQEMSKSSILDLQKLQETIKIIATKAIKRARITTDYLSEKICNKTQELVDKGLLKLKLSLFNVTHITIIQCNCSKEDNDINQISTNSGLHYTTPEANTESQSEQDNAATIKSYRENSINFNTTHDVMPNFETTTTSAYESYAEPTTNNETQDGDTTDKSMNNYNNQEQTSNYHETYQTLSPEEETSTSGFYNENMTNSEEITSAEEENTTTGRRYNTETPNSTICPTCQGNFTEEEYNELEVRETVSLKQTTAVASYTANSTVGDTTLEGKTPSNYTTTKTPENYSETTYFLDVHTVNESHPTQEVETTFLSQNKTLASALDSETNFEASEEKTISPAQGITTSRRDIEHSTSIPYTHYGDTTEPYTKSKSQSDSNKDDFFHETQQTLSSEMTPTMNDENYNGNTTVAKYETAATVSQHTPTDREESRIPSKHNTTTISSDKEQPPLDQDTHDTETTSVLKLKSTTSEPYSKTLEDINSFQSTLLTSSSRPEPYGEVTSTESSAASVYENTTQQSVVFQTEQLSSSKTTPNDLPNSVNDNQGKIFYTPEYPSLLELESTPETTVLEGITTLEDLSEISTAYEGKTGSPTHTTQKYSSDFHYTPQEITNSPRQSTGFYSEYPSATLHAESTSVSEPMPTTTGYSIETGIHTNETYKGKTSLYNHQATTTGQHRESTSGFYVRKDSYVEKSTWSLSTLPTIGYVSESTTDVNIQESETGVTSDESHNEQTVSQSKIVGTIHSQTQSSIRNVGELLQNNLQSHHTNYYSTTLAAEEGKVTREVVPTKSTNENRTSQYGEMTSSEYESTRPESYGDTTSLEQKLTTSEHVTVHLDEKDITLTTQRKFSSEYVTPHSGHYSENQFHEQVTDEIGTTIPTYIQTEWYNKTGISETPEGKTTPLETKYTVTSKTIFHPKQKATTEEYHSENPSLISGNYSKATPTPRSKPSTTESHSEQQTGGYEKEPDSLENKDTFSRSLNKTDVHSEEYYDPREEIMFLVKNGSTTPASHSDYPTSDKGNTNTIKYNTTTAESSSEITLHTEKTVTERSTVNEETSDGNTTLNTTQATTQKDISTKYLYNTTTTDVLTSGFTTSPHAVTTGVTKEMTRPTFLLHVATTTAKPPGPFRCLHAGYFRDPNDCHSFYRCKAVFTKRKTYPKYSSVGQWKLMVTYHTCKNGRWFSQYFWKCVRFRPQSC